MNTLRELVLILSTFAWIGAGIWIAVYLIAADHTASEEEAKALAPKASYYVFGAAIAVFALTSFVWKKRADI